jgi:hypothetical protein
VRSFYTAIGSQQSDLIFPLTNSLSTIFKSQKKKLRKETWNKKLELKLHEEDSPEKTVAICSNRAYFET